MKQTLDQVFAKWPELSGISDERKSAIELMLKCEWELCDVWTPRRRQYGFSRPDTGGLWDTMVIWHADLKPLDVARRLIDYEFDIKQRVNTTLRVWINEKLEQTT